MTELLHVWHGRNNDLIKLSSRQALKKNVDLWEAQVISSWQLIPELHMHNFSVGWKMFCAVSQTELLLKQVPRLHTKTQKDMYINQLTYTYTNHCPCIGLAFIWDKKKKGKWTLGKPNYCELIFSHTSNNSWSRTLIETTSKLRVTATLLPKMNFVTKLKAPLGHIHTPVLYWLL